MKKIIKVATLSLYVFLVSCKNDPSNKSNSNADSLKFNNEKQTYNLKNQYSIVPPSPDYTGDHIEKYPNGIVKFSGFFRFGERHGQWMAFYENGNLWSECFYDKGKKDGASNVYYGNGKLQFKGWYKNDLKDSLWFFYDTLGKEIDKRAFRNGEETGLVN